MIERLRKEDFNQKTEVTLSSHPYLLSAENGSLNHGTTTRVCVPTIENSKIRRHFFCPSCGTLRISAPVSPAEDLILPTVTTRVSYPKYKEYPDLFQFLLQGEVYAASLLLDYAQHSGLEGERAILQHAKINEQVAPMAQAYPSSYWARGTTCLVQ